MNLAISTKIGRRKNRLSDEDREIITAINQLKRELDFVYKNLDYATEPDLIDSYIYEMKSLQMKYKYYLGLCKERGIVSGM